MAKTNPATPSPAYAKQEAEWRAEEDMRTLARAEEIRGDPARLRAAKACAKKKVAEMQAVANTK